jgi:hypothetical protein
VVIFQLKLLSHHWIQGSTDPYGEPGDVTSHGNVSLVINGEDISGCQYADSELGINQSSVALLQSVITDHEFEESLNSPIFYHGCTLLGTCPNRVIDYRVRHIAEEKVILDHFIVTGHAIADSKTHFEEVLTIPNIEYASQVLTFAEEALKFLPKKRRFNKVPMYVEDGSIELKPTPDLDKWEFKLYEALRSEHEDLITIVKKYLKEGRISDRMRKRASDFDLSVCSKRNKIKRSKL